jgi:hypothetical protein
MIVERILLRTIKFDLTVDHPYTFLLEYAKLFIESPADQYVQRMVRVRRAPFPHTQTGSNGMDIRQ